MRLAESKEDGHMHAIKIIDKKALRGKEDSLENEIRVLKRYNTDACFREFTRILVVWQLFRILTLPSSIPPPSEGSEAPNRLYFLNTAWFGT